MKCVEKDDEYDFYKNDGDKIWDADDGSPRVGVLEFTFDKKKIYNFWEDYPQNLTKEEKEIFDKENPHWAALKCETEEEYLILKKRIEEMSDKYREGE